MLQPAPTAQVSEVVRLLALAWKNLISYPPGHPALAGSFEPVRAQLSELRGGAPDVVFGVAADGLMYSGAKIDSIQAQKLAQSLYSRGVALIRFDAATSTQDLERFLRLLGGSATQDKRPIWEELNAAGVMNIHLQPVDYSSVQVTDNLSAPAPPPRPPDQRTSLWDEILRALMAGKHISTRDTAVSPVNSIDELSAMLAKYVDAAPAADLDGTFGAQRPETRHAITRRVAEAVAGYLTSTAGLRRQFAIGQITQLLRTLPADLRASVLRSVLRVLSTDDSAASQLRDLATVLPRDEVLDGLRYVAQMTKVSPHAMAMLKTLAPLDQRARPEASAPTGTAGDLLELFAEEDIDRFRAGMQESRTVPVPLMHVQPAEGSLGDRAETISDEQVHRNLAYTLLDLVERHASADQPATALLGRIEHAFRGLLGSAQFADAVEIIDRLQSLSTRPALRDDIRASLARLASAETIASLVTGLQDAPPETGTLIKRLIAAMGKLAVQNLLIALAEESNRSRRRRLFDFTSSLGPAIVGEATAFLSDGRWYVVRNMIVLLRTVGDRSSLPEIHRLARHPDLRVRLEAIKTLLAFEPAVPSSLLENAINDPDPKLAETAISLVASYGIKEGVAPLLKILDGWDVLQRRRSTRLKALAALGELGEPSALDALSRFFTEPFLPWPALAERYAAWESLSGYPAEARQRLVAKGAKSKDPRIRSLCRRIQRGE